jgi:hypothetical protein
VGTSVSSRGPGANVPLVPPWADTPPTDAPQGDSPPSPDGETPEVPANAPERRFQPARRQLRDFARNGGAASLRRAIGQYVARGYGGAAYATRRLGGTANSAAALGGVLDGLAGIPDEQGLAVDRALLEGRTADEVMDAIVEACRPVDGTQDAEASRLSMRDALADVLTRYPDADLLLLTPEQRDFAMERFVALDVWQRFDLDMGKDIRDNAPSLSAAMERLKEAKDYIVETVAAAFRGLRAAGRRMTAGRISTTTRDALREAFDVFEGAAE